MVVFGLSTLTERLFYHGCVWPLDSHREIVLSWLCLASRLSQRDCSIMVVFGLSTLTERLFYHGCVWPLDSHREIVLCLMSLFDIHHSVRSQSLAQCPVGTGYSLLLFEYGESELFCSKKFRIQVAVSSQKFEGKLKRKSFTVFVRKSRPLYNKMHR